MLVIHFFLTYKTFRKDEIPVRQSPFLLINIFLCTFVQLYLHKHLFQKFLPNRIVQISMWHKDIIIKPTFIDQLKKITLPALVQNWKQTNKKNPKCIKPEDVVTHFHLCFHSVYVGYLCSPPLSTAIWLLPRKYASVFVRIKDAVLVPEGLLGNDLFYILH